LLRSQSISFKGGKININENKNLLQSFCLLLLVHSIEGVLDHVLLCLPLQQQQQPTSTNNNNMCSSKVLLLLCAVKAAETAAAAATE